MVARALYHFRRFVILTYGLWAAGLFAWLLARRFFADLRAPGATVPSIVAVAALGGLLLGKLARRLKPTAARDGVHAVLADVELGLILLVALFATLQLTGGARSPLHPLVYALIAYLVSFHTFPVGAGLVAATLALEAVLFFASPRGIDDRALAAAHGAFIGFFAVVNFVFLHAELFRQRRAHEARIVTEIIRLREEARDFRVITSGLSPERRTRSRAEEEEKLYQGAVENIHQGLYFLLEMLKKTLGLQTCIVLLLDDGHCLRAQALEVCARGRAHEREFRATSLPTLVQMVASGAGVPLLPLLSLPAEVRRGELTMRPFARPAPHRTLALIWRPRAPVGDALRQLAATIRAAYPAPDERLLAQG